MWFQLYSHANLYKDEGDSIAKSTIYSRRMHHFRRRKNKKDVESPGSTSVLTGTMVAESASESQETPEVKLETPQMTGWMSICLFAIAAVVSYLDTLVFFRIDTFHTDGSSYCRMALRLH